MAFVSGHFLLCGDAQQLFTIFCKITQKWQLSHTSDAAFLGRVLPISELSVIPCVRPFAHPYYF